MTAILHALLYGSAKEDKDPARLLQRMNEEFHAIGRRAKETLFVTAVHMIIDAGNHLIRYAVAGHPSPLVVDRNTGDVSALVPEDQATAAAGLYDDTVYTYAEFSIDKELSILLYTDGVTEAQNARQEEFGIDRLVQAVGDACGPDRRGLLPEHVMDSLEAFMDTAPAMDDICLLSINVAKSPKR
jgi:sigma-B regulation protein RsbU (phosphoserine phosphatase)